MRLSILLVLAIPLSASAYEKNLDWVFADLKRPLAGLDGSLDATNYRAVLDGLKHNLHCNGLRLAIDLSIANPQDYPQLYRDVVAWAHAESMAIYANPLGTGRHGLSQAQLVARVTRYANYFKPRFLGPFNESNLTRPQ